MKKIPIVFIICMCCFAGFANAQVGIYVGPSPYRRAYRHPPHRSQMKRLPPFQPSVNLSFGYGFPNLDRYALPGFYGLYKGTTTSQTGPITGAFDYRFSRSMSLGVLVTHGNVKVPYYNYNNSANPALYSSLENCSVMLNLMSYIAATDKVAPYIRTAIGFNSWQQTYTNRQGDKVNMDGNPSELAYQVSLGANFYLSKNAGLFFEGGYGKYILEGGLTFKF